jgi:hypothetical protein
VQGAQVRSGGERDGETPEQRGVLSAALSSVTKAITTPVALTWSSRSLKQGELSAELLKNRKHLAIYLLPRAFASLNRPMASEFADIWQFGGSKTRPIEEIKRSYPNKTLRVCRFKQIEFKSSNTIANVVRSMLDKNVAVLPQMSGSNTALDERWTSLRRLANDALKRHKNQDQWSEATASFQNTLEYPDVYLEKRAIGTDTFVANGESPLSSDAYGALGPFAARAYLEAVLSKKSGEDRVFVKPIRVGVRIWDNYNFDDFSDSDPEIVKSLAKVLGRLSSQFLGIWNDRDTDDSIVLQNLDFQSYRNDFMPSFNQQQPAPTRKMVCQDFSSVSDFVTRAIDGGAEYPLDSL